MNKLIRNLLSDCRTRAALYRQSFTCKDRGLRHEMRWVAIHDEIGMVRIVSERYRG